jgi:L-alanine-DL-glutamate epimerase-like enolase superfamily enzyme
MASATDIVAMEIHPLDLPLLRPFGIAGGVQHSAANVLVGVTLADGARGLGEAAPLPAYDGMTQRQVLAALAAARGLLVGGDAREWRALGGRVARGPARAAVETALLDALARRGGRALWREFGGACSEIETDMTVALGGTLEESAREAAAIAGEGFHTLKLKVGSPAGVDDDLARIDAVARAAPGLALILDGNAGLSRAAATALLNGLRQRDIRPALLEQWLPAADLAGMRALGEESGLKVAADEAVRCAADVRRVADARAAHVVNVKLMKAGVGEALDVIATTRTAGLGLMMGGNLESILAMTMAACVAAGFGGFEFIDLDTPAFIASHPFTGGFSRRGPRIDLLPVAEGHGVSTNADGAPAKRGQRDRPGRV